MVATLITAKIVPDIDAVACGLAYAEFLSHTRPEKNYQAGFWGSPHTEVAYVLSALDLKYPRLDEGAHDQKFEEFILVDFSARPGLPEIVELNKVIQVIDHRDFADQAAFPSAEFIIEQVGAAATIITEFFAKQPTVLLDSEIAALLLCAIYSNTLDFKSSNTTARDLAMKVWLEKSMHEWPTLVTDMFKHKQLEIEANLNQVLLSDKKNSDTDFGELKMPDFYQLELLDATKVLSDIDRLKTFMLQSNPKAGCHLLFVQDIGKGKTFIVCDNQDTASIVGKKLPVEKVLGQNVLQLDRLMLRKSILSVLKD